MAMLKLVYLSAFSLFFLVTVKGLTNLEFLDFVEEHGTDIVIDKSATCEDMADSGNTDKDQELNDDVMIISGEPDDEFEADSLLEKLGFEQNQSDNECDDIKKPEDTVKFAHIKYCHYRQFLIHGLQNQDKSGNGEHLKDIQCRYHHHGNDHHHGHHFHIHFHHDDHCHHRDYVKCQCKRKSCWCCLRHTFRYNSCSYRRSFELNSCVTFEYKGKKREPVTTTKAPKTTTQAPKTTTRAPKTTTKAPKTTTQAPKTTTKAPKTTTQAPKTTTKAPKTTTQAPKTTTQAPKTTTISTTTTNGTPPPREDSPLKCSSSLYDVTFTVNKHKVYEHDVALKDLHPMCYNLYVGGGRASLCAKFYSINTRTNSVCIRLEGQWKRGCRVRRIYLTLGCLKLPFSRNSELMDILADRKYWKEMVMNQNYDEE